MAVDELTLEARLLPPPEPSRVYLLGGIGIVMTTLAMILGFITGENGPSISSTLRLFLVAGGLLLAGSAISMRSSLPLAWFLSAVAFGAAILGLPSHWDSARIVAGVGCGVSLAGTLLSALPLTFRCAILSAMAMWHYVGVFCATTWPDPAPYTTEQLGTRVYLPYMMFMYLRNAYHFYSPNPGPASLIFALVKYDQIDPKTNKPLADWLVVPNRSTDFKDPLGLTYYRRLSITEQLSSSIPPFAFSFEQPEVADRRRMADGRLGGLPNYPKIPIAPDYFEPQSAQYKMPRPDVLRYLLPSYANYILTSETRAATATSPAFTPVSVKLYRLEHRVTPAYAFASSILPQKPNHPITFRPYYLGEYARNPETGKVELMDPQDPLLFWLVPILPRPARPNVPNDVDYDDFMSLHAGFAYDWSNRKP